MYMNIIFIIYEYVYKALVDYDINTYTRNPITSIYINVRMTNKKTSWKFPCTFTQKAAHSKKNIKKGLR